LLVDSAGRPVPLQLVPDGIWQSAEVALIDLEDGSGDCQNGTPAMNTKLIGLAPDRNYRELRFTLGVPADLNHADPLTATSPLTSSAMHWHWRSGYKFLRAGVKAGDDGFRLHLGSAGCHGVIGNLSGCDAGNRPAVKLSNLQGGQHRIVFDLAALLANVNLADAASEVCEMGPDDPCDAVVTTLGLDVNGDSVGPTNVFRLAR
ncbi:MAG: metallo-mystery pair system four-Cys motif protein, partial [Woeseia sp.]|nr:metallo-mystery pair system four-Cys motif protein [Woeseia sp.]